jgi:hypothetical protein
VLAIGHMERFLTFALFFLLIVDDLLRGISFYQTSGLFRS